MNALRLFAGVTLLILGTVGCSTSPQTNYNTQNWCAVSGIVKLDGRPLSGAYVQFAGDDGISSSGMTDANGRYELRFDSNQIGIPPGKKTVQVRTNYQSGETDITVENEKAAPPSQTEKIPAKYHDESTLTADVSNSKLQFDFELASK